MDLKVGDLVTWRYYWGPKHPLSEQGRLLRIFPGINVEGGYFVVVEFYPNPLSINWIKKVEDHGQIIGVL